VLKDIFFSFFLNFFEQSSVKKLMLFYEIKLINPDTNETYFREVGPKPKIPSKEIMEKYQGALLVITTTSHLLNHRSQEDEKKAS
jgi:hypothetical protein